MNLRVWMGMLAVVATANAADVPPVAFEGALLLGKEVRVALAGPSDTAMTWVKPGDSFQGYVVKAYDAAKHTVTLEKDGKPLDILQDLEGTSPVLVKSPGSIAEAQVVIEGIHFDQLISKALEGPRTALSRMAKTSAARGGGKATPEETAAFDEKIAGILKGFDTELVKTDVTQIYAQIYSKEELKGLADFYATPLGQVFSSKQTQISQKMQEAIMPRISNVRAQIQAASMEFAQLMKAKNPPAPVQGAAPSTATLHPLTLAPGATPPASPPAVAPIQAPPVPATPTPKPSAS